MKNKIQLAFNQIGFENDLRNETAKADKLNKALELVKLITEGKLSTIDIDALNSFLNDTTGFRNVGMSASALNLDIEYQLIVDASQIASEYISLENGKYIVDENSIKEYHTLYLKDAETEVYNTLLKAYKILNSVDSRYYQCINENGVDKQRLRAITNVFFTR